VWAKYTLKWADFIPDKEAIIKGSMAHQTLLKNCLFGDLKKKKIALTIWI